VNEEEMGITHATLRLSNPANPSLAPLDCEALADTGALHLCIPEHVALQLSLSLSSQEPREVTLADGSKRLIPYIGPIQVRYGTRNCFVGGLVMGDEVLLGAVPREDMDLVVRPMTREVMVNPASRNIPSAVVKGYSMS
jgi:clan AA aspartic protease